MGWRERKGSGAARSRGDCSTATQHTSRRSKRPGVRAATRRCGSGRCSGRRGGEGCTGRPSRACRRWLRRKTETWQADIETTPVRIRRPRLQLRPPNQWCCLLVRHISCARRRAADRKWVRLHSGYVNLPFVIGFNKLTGGTSYSSAAATNSIGKWVANRVHKATAGASSGTTEITLNENVVGNGPAALAICKIRKHAAVKFSVSQSYLCSSFNKHLVLRSFCTIASI
jgi:hypothetical protein